MDPGNCSEFVEAVRAEAHGPPKPSDLLVRSPCKWKADARERRSNQELAAVLSKTERQVLHFHQGSGLPQQQGQAALDMFRHPKFNIKVVQTTTIVQRLWRLERPFKECSVST